MSKKPIEFALWLTNYLRDNIEAELSTDQFAKIYEQVAKVDIPEKPAGYGLEKQIWLVARCAKSNAGGQLLGTDYEHLLGDNFDPNDFSVGRAAAINQLRAVTKRFSEIQIKPSQPSGETKNKPSSGGNPDMKR